MLSMCSLPFSSTPNPLILHHLRLHRPHRPLHKRHHPLHHTPPRLLARDLLTPQIPQPHQPPHPLIPHLPHPLPPALLPLHPSPQDPISPPLQHQRLPLRHAPPPKQRFKPPHRLPEPLVLERLLPHRGPLAPRRDAPDPAIAQVREIRVPRRHDAQHAADAPLPQHAVPQLLAAQRVQQRRAQGVLLARNERARRVGARGRAYEPRLQRRDVRARDVQPHHVDLDGQERHGAYAQPHELVGLVRVAGADGEGGRRR